MDKELIFGLDIGTRTVIGMAGYMEDDKWHILQSVCVEHEQRAMLDGQIHDIKKVESIVRNVKQQLETLIGCKLEKVAIAAAGRVLNTQIVRVEQLLETSREINTGDIQSLELLGIEEAKKLLEKDKKRDAAEYFCVAYTVTHYYLDEYELANLEGHNGQKIGAQILTTFLPKGVIESLYTVTERVGLEVSHLTLEPIAAMNAVIPENLRLLNLALVDVGAGTSDIAITKEGTVVAYGMIPVAGDEVTETIVHKYLVDFNTAEKIKQSLNTEQIIEFEDIIGMPYSIAKEEIVACIQPSVEELANQVAKNVVKLNGKKSPNAVFCVGGGSQMPGFTEKLAQALELPYQRVAVRSMAHIQNVVCHQTISEGPEMITPTGICMTAYQNQHRQFTQVSINNQMVRMMNTKKLTVLDALLEFGVKHTQIFPSNGTMLMFKVNGKRVRLKGQIGEVATLLRNNEPISLETFIQEGDKITFKPAKSGKNPQAKLSEYINDEWCRTIYYKEEVMDLPIVMINGDSVTNRNTKIQNQDQIDIYPVETIGAFINLFKVEEGIQNLLLNGEAVTEQTMIKPFDHIQILNSPMPLEGKKQAYKHIETQVQEVQNLGIKVQVNDQWIHLTDKEMPYLFVDIFDYIDFDLTTPQGTVQLLLNDAKAAVTDLIHDNDRIKIFWEK